MGGSHPTRTEATIGLVAAVAWFALTAQESTSAYPWNQGDDFAIVSQTIGGTLSGVIVIIAFVWLAGLGRRA
ncbi:MAG: hypothetical protein QOF08_2896 [Gaiellales bacterium]|nr:hypothetical protein [Gaiellales bacterium]